LARKEVKGRFEVVYCGSLGFDQKLDTIIRSIPDWPLHADLVLIGNETTRTAGALRDLSRNLKLEGRVRFLGWMDTHAAEQRIALSDLGIALFDSSNEQFRTALGASNKRFQFMKAGLPQIGDENPGIRQLLEDNGVGACVTSHEPSEIAALVRAYAQNPQRCSVEGARAFALHHFEFNYEQVFGRLLDRLKIQ
jgi:glycosyltransferase involved in cell wall biosynthesis